MNPITNIALHRKVSVSEFKEAFELRKDRPHLWLQKLCFYFLRKIGAWHMKEDIAYERVSINTEDFMERIFKSERIVHEFCGRHGAVLLIGSEDYAFLMHSQVHRAAFSFDAGYYAAQGGRPRLYGLKVHVLPYLRGMAVLPAGL